MYQTTALVSHQIVSNRIRVDDLMEKYEWNKYSVHIIRGIRITQNVNVH